MAHSATQRKGTIRFLCFRSVCGITYRFILASALAARIIIRIVNCVTPVTHIEWTANRQVSNIEQICPCTLTRDGYEAANQESVADSTGF